MNSRTVGVIQFVSADVNAVSAADVTKAAVARLVPLLLSQRIKSSVWTYGRSLAHHSAAKALTGPLTAARALPTKNVSGRGETGGSVAFWERCGNR